jgi:hypothetical protein
MRKLIEIINTDNEPNLLQTMDLSVYKKQPIMEKKIFAVIYYGNAKRYQDEYQEVAAYTKREAVERIYAKMLNKNYFPEDDHKYGGIVRDCDGNVIANVGDETIAYDGGYFVAVLKVIR